MSSTRTDPQPRLRFAARKDSDVEDDQETQLDDPVMQYLMNKQHREPFDHCLWYSRGMHHVQFPGHQLHTAVQNAEKDQYIAVMGHCSRRKHLFYRAHRALRALTTPFFALTATGKQPKGAGSRNVPHIHLCIVTTDKGAPKRFETMSLAQTLLWCDQKGLAAYLECCTAAHLPFYKARGFVVVQTVDEAEEGCARLHALWRMPKRKSWTKEVVGKEVKGKESGFELLCHSCFENTKGVEMC